MVQANGVVDEVPDAGRERGVLCKVQALTKREAKAEKK